MRPKDRSRLVNLTQTMVQVPEFVPKLVKQIRSGPLEPDFAAAVEALEEGYRERGGSFDKAAAKELADRLMQERDEHKREAGWTLADSIDVLSRG